MICTIAASTEKLMICTIAASTGPQPNSWWWALADEEELEAWWRRAKKSQDLLSNSVPHCISPQWSAWSKAHCFTSGDQIPYSFLFWPTLIWSNIKEGILRTLVSSLIMLILTLGMLIKSITKKCPTSCRGDCKNI